MSKRAQHHPEFKVREREEAVSELADRRGVHLFPDSACGY